MPRGRPSTRGTPAASEMANTSREASASSVRITRAATRSQAASSASTPVQGTELQAEAPSVPRPRGRPRKSVQAIEIASSTAESSALDVAPPKKRRGRPSKAFIEIESTSSAPTPQDGTSESGYSTPATSKGPTPTATDSFKSTSNFQVVVPGPSRLSGQDRERASRKSIYAMNKGTKDNRTILDSDDDEDFPDNSRDAQLARRLQQEDMAQYTTSSLPRRSTRTSDLAGLVLSSAPQKAPAKRGRSSTSSALQTSRPSKKSKVIPDSDEGESDINMDAEIAAAAGLGSDDEYDLGLKSDGDASFADLEDASDRDGIADLSSEDDFVPVSRRRQARAPPRRLAPATVPAPAPASTSAPQPTQAAPADYPITIDSDYETTDPPTGFSISDTDDDPNDINAMNAAALQSISRSRRAYRATGSSRRLKKERDRLETHHPEIKTMWQELENMPVLKAGKAPQPQTISRQLKPFQLEGLAWMMEMEKTEWKGGLLGDEMGLGKTIQAVSLIMSDYPAKQPTLVLVPPVALMQWQQEIKSYTDGTLKTFVFHGTNQKSKKMTLKDLKAYDVLMMSYNSLESMYRKQVKGFVRKDGTHKMDSLIHKINFHRIILDEAHCIKTRTTMTAKACFALKTTYRWCLSGTPLQNRIGELFSLVRFLNIRPFASYLCKQCPCSTLEWSMDSDSRCSQCKHAGMQHVSVFNQELLNPIQKYGNMGPGREAFGKLRLMTDRIMLRRLKKDHTNSMELPVKEIYVDRQFFGEEENDFANSIMTNGQRKFDTYVAQGVLLNNYANIFGLIMQMRQVADHPDLILKKDAEGGQNVLICCICDEPAEDTVRSRCKHDFCRACVSSYVRSTAEPDCPRCHISLSIDLEQPEIEQDEALVKKNSIINRIKMENWTSSSKIELLVHELHKLRSDNASHKSIIFSQFTTMLQLIEWRLRRAGITTVMLDGSMTPAQRQASIEHFMNNVDVECFLVSLKAGGVALNLTEASRVFIVDPWWNPAAEWQSADRCHRIGQTRPCTITRLCIEDSVESRMVLIQEKKTSMIHSTVNADDKAMDSLSPQDMQFLFRGS